MLPISVLVPTRNSMSLLPQHLEMMRAWQGGVEEIIAVDSHSTDGTLELLQKTFSGAGQQVLTHPPGLYQSWNFGISECRARYLYVSTVGELITLEGLRSLAEAMERLEADIVISPPRMVDMEGRDRPKSWPIHDFINQAGLQQAVALEGAAAQVFSVQHLRRGILGSSASNLYRTRLLQRFPFRTDFGTAGDLAWGLEHAGEARLAIVPESFSTFVFHPKAYAKSDYAVSDFNEKCLALARTAAAKSSRSDTESGRMLQALLTAWEPYLVARRQVAQDRRNRFWWLRPGAWLAVRERARTLAELESVRNQAQHYLQRALIRA